MRYRGPPAAALIVRPLDAMVAVFHRPSGTTHLLAPPAPEILAALADRALDPDGLVAVLAAEWELDGDAADTRAALIDRLDELAAIGLVERV